MFDWILGSLSSVFQIGRKGPQIVSGQGDPEGVVTAIQGSIFMRWGDGGASTSFYVKESGSGPTGWQAK